MTRLVLLFATLASLASAADWYQLTPEDFARLPEAQQRIDPATFDRPLLSAAIFHATNVVRRQLGLPRFTHLAKLDDAADLKAALGVLEPELRHESNVPARETPAQRVESTGLRYSLIAENIARLPTYEMPPGERQLAVRRENGRDAFYHVDTGRKAELHTYAGFATFAVASWMKSPGHRANLVNPALKSLGCAARPCHSLVVRHEQIYAVQIFFTPESAAQAEPPRQQNVRPPAPNRLGSR